MQRRAVELQTPQEKKQQTELERMMQNAGDKVTMIQMTVLIKAQWQSKGNENLGSG